MKLLTAKVIDGRLDVPAGTLEDGVVVTILVPEDETGFELTEEEVASLRESMDEIARGEWIDGQRLLDELG